MAWVVWIFAGCGSAVQFPAQTETPDVVEGGCQSLEDCPVDHVCVAGECEAFTPADPGNAPPRIVIASPANGSLNHVGEALVLEAVVTDDGPLEGLLVAWHTNLGGVIGQATLDADGRASLSVDDLTAGNHTLTAAVTDLGGWDDQASIWFAMDGRPSRPTIRLDPESPTVSDDLVVTIIHHAVDDNRSQDKLTTRYRWFVDQVEREEFTGPVVPYTATIRGQAWTVRVSAADPFGEGDEAPASVIIGNSAPVCPAAALLPSVADTTTAITCL